MKRKCKVGTARRFLAENLVYPIRPFHTSPKYTLVLLGLTVTLLLGSCSQESPQSPRQVAPASQANPAPVPDQILRAVTDKSGRHKAKVVQRGDKQLVILDERPGPEYDRIGIIAFSADGRSLAYEAMKGKQKVVVLDEHEWPLDVDMVQDSFTLSPDNKRLALVACSRGKCLVMVDGRPDPPFDHVFLETIRFSPDSQHTGYLAIKGKKLQVVVDGKVQEQMDILTEGNKVLTAYLSRADQADVAQTPGEPPK